MKDYGAGREKRGQSTAEWQKQKHDLASSHQAAAISFLRLVRLVVFPT